MAVLRGRASNARPRSACAALAFALLSAAWPAAAAAAPPRGIALEYAVKANFLYKFGPFVEWPPHVFDSAAGAFNVCIVGVDPFGRALDDAVRGQSVANHPVAVRRIQGIRGLAGCHVLYVGRRKGQASAEIVAAAQGSPVLVVTDESQGVSGGMIHFVLRNGRVRFLVDPARALANGLTLSSKLQALAVPSGAGE
jgi:hypothetical protein